MEATYSKADYHRMWRANNKEKIASYSKKYKEKIKTTDIKKGVRRTAEKRLVKYGLTLEQRQAILEKQGGKCAVCLTAAPKLNVDHCHSTGKVRGLLCTNCNLGLGHFKDEPERLVNAIAYLRGGSQ